MNTVMHFSGTISIEPLLASMPIEYRITRDYALTVLGVNNRSSPDYCWIYVCRDSLPQLVDYLSSQNVEEVISDGKHYASRPTLIVQVVDALPAPFGERKTVVNREKLIKDLPARLKEFDPEIIERLREVA